MISKEFLPFIRSYSPELLDELEGIAQGADVEFADLLTLNSRSEAMTLVRRPPSDKEELDGCSSVAVLPDASAKWTYDPGAELGHLHMGRNTAP